MYSKYTFTREEKHWLWFPKWRGWDRVAQITNILLFHCPYEFTEQLAIEVVIAKSGNFTNASCILTNCMNKKVQTSNVEFIENQNMVLECE